MKMRTFDFPDTREGRQDFQIAFGAFRARDPQKATKDERQWFAQVQRALESVSDPVGEEPEDDALDLRARKLQSGGGTITITQKAHEKLELWLEECPLQTGVALQAENFRDRWGQAEKLESEETQPTAKPAKPTRIKSA